MLRSSPLASLLLVTALAACSNGSPSQQSSGDTSDPNADPNADTSGDPDAGGGGGGGGYPSYDAGDAAKPTAPQDAGGGGAGDAATDAPGASDGAAPDDGGAAGDAGGPPPFPDAGTGDAAGAPCCFDGLAYACPASVVCPADPQQCIQACGQDPNCVDKCLNAPSGCTPDPAHDAQCP